MTSPDGAGTKPFRTTGKLTGFVVRCAVTLGLLWLLGANIDLEAVGGTFAAASPGWIVVTLVLGFTQPVLGTGRWRIVCRQLGKPLHFLMLLRFTLIGVFFNQCLPSTVGGDAVRIWLARRAGVCLAPYTQGMDLACPLRQIIDDDDGSIDDLVLTLAVDGDGELWVGTDGQGLFRLDAVNTTGYLPGPSGLPSERSI